MGCLNLLNKRVKSFSEEIIFWILNPMSSKKRREKQVIKQEPVQEMNDEDLCLLFMKQDLLVGVLCYGVLGPHIKFVTLIFQ